MTAVRPGTSAARVGRPSPAVANERGPLPVAVPVDRWSAPASASDRLLLSHCRGAVLDVGCGPGRMAAHLASEGHDVLGVDVLPEAVEMTSARGVEVLHQDVFDPLPDEGAWDTALLADGNIGIGGDPVALLGRLRSVIAPLGRVVADLAEPGTGFQRRTLVLQAGGVRLVPFAWAVVGPGRIGGIAAEAGLGVRHVSHHEGRWFAVLEKVR